MELWCKEKGNVRWYAIIISYNRKVFYYALTCNILVKDLEDKNTTKSKWNRNIQNVAILNYGGEKKALQK